MKETNFPAEVISKINPSGKTRQNSIQRVTLFSSNLLGQDIYSLIAQQTENFRKVPFYSGDMKNITFLDIANEESKLKLVKFNYFLTKLHFSPQRDKDHYGYFALNPGEKDSLFLSFGISLDTNYYGLQFFFLDDKNCKVNEIANSSLEKIIQIN